MSYRIDRPHDPTEDVAIAFDDPELDIPWPLPVALQSPRDRRALPLVDTLAPIAMSRALVGAGMLGGGIVGLAVAGSSVNGIPAWQ